MAQATVVALNWWWWALGIPKSLLPEQKSSLPKRKPNIEKLGRPITGGQFFDMKRF
jgi:hypothetical protein